MMTSIEVKVPARCNVSTLHHVIAQKLVGTGAPINERPVLYYHERCLDGAMPLRLYGIKNGEVIRAKFISSGHVFDVKVDGIKSDDDFAESFVEVDRTAALAQARRFRLGACANCGAQTHDVKSCFERPRRTGAKLTGKNIAADDKMEAGEGSHKYKDGR